VKILLETSSNISRASMRNFLERTLLLIVITAGTTGESEFDCPPKRVIELEPDKWGAVFDAPEGLEKWGMKIGLFSMADKFRHKIENVNVESGDP